MKTKVKVALIGAVATITAAFITKIISTSDGMTFNGDVFIGIVNNVTSTPKSTEAPIFTESPVQEPMLTPTLESTIKPTVTPTSVPEIILIPTPKPTLEPTAIPKQIAIRDVSEFYSDGIGHSKSTTTDNIGNTYSGYTYMVAGDFWVELEGAVVYRNDNQYNRFFGRVIIDDIEKK